MTHVAIGFACNNESVRVVELYSEKPLLIEKVEESPDGGVLVKGLQLNPTKALLYLARIIP